MLKTNPCRASHFLTATFCCVFIIFFHNSNASAKEKKEDVQSPKQKHKFMDRIKTIVDGFEVGDHERVFPYASLEDWFDPYGGLRLNHCAPGNPADKISHHFKFETIQDFSWKARYLANSLSSETTKFSFLFKLKFDRDAFFYGIGNATAKPDRDRASYESIFFGTEVTKIISEKALLRISPGYWQFKSGLVEGGEFEQASDAKYVTTRFTLSDRYLMDYRNTSFDNHWSSYVEIGFPVTSSVASYSRINFQTLTRIPVYKNTKFSVKARLEFLFSDDRSLVPYFAMPEVGSRSGLRGFSKDRFRNFSLSNINLEYAVPLSSYFETFVLMDLAQTAPRVHELLGKHVHTDYGFGLRVTSLRHPFSVGMAKSTEGWKLFSNVSVRF